MAVVPHLLLLLCGLHVVSLVADSQLMDQKDGSPEVIHYKDPCEAGTMRLFFLIHILYMLISYLFVCIHLTLLFLWWSIYTYIASLTN